MKSSLIIAAALPLPMMALGQTAADKQTGGKQETAAAIVNGNPVHKKKSMVELFNIYEPQAKADVALLETAEKLFLVNETNTYADVLAKPEMLAALKAAGRELVGGPMLGDVSTEGISVWVRTIKPSEVKVVVINAKGKKFSAAATSTVESDHSAVVKIKGLKAQSDYTYEIFVDGKKVNPGKDIELAFSTPVKPYDKNEGRIIFGSCFHRWGLSHVKQAELIMAREPDALVFNGDISVQDKFFDVSGHCVDNFLRDLYVPWRKMIAKFPVYATWDDHDYMRNDYGGVPRNFPEKGRGEITNVWRQSWVNPYYGNGTEGIYTSAVVGPVEIIMVDNRYFRQTKPNFMGEEQMNWLKEKLLNSKARFKILSCGTMWSDIVSDGKDSWGQYDPEGRDALFKMIVDNNISGVLLISGDRHGARGFGVPVTDEFSLYEFGGASLGGRSGPPAIIKGCKTQLYGISHRFAFSEFTFGGSKSNPTLEFNLLCGETGEPIFNRIFSYDELTPKKK